ncbi:MAG: transcriptional repressor [Bdellovibrionaceae bacterium]|nr:transcriptional repressor [Bdellovibrionales bacterium]MCB9085385.1 transcriptional repressor [Pseudobdellovibrionaceae bacterium]
MKKRADLVSYLRSKGLRMTPSKELLIQFFIDNQKRYVSSKELQDHVGVHLPDVDRTTVYRNIEKLIALELIQELDLPKTGKAYQFIFDRKAHHYYICKGCGEVKQGDGRLFARIEKALKEIHDFSKAQMSVVFYGYCLECKPGGSKETSM